METSRLKMGNKHFNKWVSAKILLLGLIITPFIMMPASAQTWVQQGADIDGAASDNLGSSTVLSSDGLTMAVGASLNGVGTGYVKVYTYSGTWSQKGSTIDGAAVNDKFGYSISLSADGNTIAVGAEDNAGGAFKAGEIRVFEWDDISSDWVQKGGDIDGEATADRFGKSVALSADGTTLIGGGIYNDGIGSNAGYAQVHQWDGAAWIQKGSDFDGEATLNEYGSSVTINSTGSVVAIGANRNAAGGSLAGHVQVYAWDGSTWTQMGSDFDGDKANEEVGYHNSISLSSSGTTIALGYRGGDGPGDGMFNSGDVRVFDWNGTTWTLRGSLFNGPSNSDRLGSSVSISSDGNVVASGAVDSEGGGSLRGVVMIFAWDGAAWTQRGSSISGEADSDNSGFSVALSSGGSRVAIGAPNNNSNAGHVRVYEFSFLDRTWNGTAWDTAPTISENAIIDGNFDSSTDGNITAHNLTVNPGNTVVIKAGDFIEVNGNLAHSGTSFIVESGGSLATKGDVTGTNFTFERTTTFNSSTGKYSVVGAPVSNANFSTLGVSAIVYGYDETVAYNDGGTNGLDKYKTPAELSQTSLQVAQGYFSANTGDVNGKVTFTGTPNMGTQSISLTYTDFAGEDAFEGYNLVSNPFPCAIDFVSFMATNSADIEGAIYLWDDNGSDVSRGDNADYVIVNNIGVVSTNSTNGGGTKWNGIHSMQGFFVQAKSAGDKTLDFTDAMKVTDNNADAGFYRTINEQMSFKLSISNEQGAYAETLIGMRSDASWEKDQYDASIFSASGTKIYSLINGEAYGIQGVPDLLQSEIPIGIQSDKLETFTVNVLEMNNLSGYSITFTDHLLNTTIDLSEGNSYSLTTSAGEINDRFSVSVKSGITAIDEVKKPSWIVYQNESGNIIFRNNANMKVLSAELISLSGQRSVLKVEQVNANEWTTKQVSKQGLFITKIITEKSEQVQRIILR